MREGPRLAPGAFPEQSLTRRAFLRLLCGVGCASLLGGAGYFFVDPFPVHGAPPRLSTLPAVPGQKILVFAPHPDDETLGSGGLIHLALRSGADVHVVLITNGDGFRVDVERLYMTLHPTPQEFVDLGLRRQKETLAAVASLGLPADRVTFLGYPDMGTAMLWREYWTVPFHDFYTHYTEAPYTTILQPHVAYTGQNEFHAVLGRLRLVQPDVVIIPHPCDVHPDHWATNAFVTAALEHLRQTGEPFAQKVRVLTYLVHWGDWPLPFGYHPEDPLYPPVQFRREGTAWYAYPLPAEVTRLKERAILDYRTQMLVMKNRLLAFARRNELFGVDPPLLVPSVPRGEVPWNRLPWTLVEPSVPPMPLALLDHLLGGGVVVRRMAVAQDPDRLHLRLLLDQLPTEDLRLTVYVTALSPSLPDGLHRWHLNVGRGEAIVVNPGGHGGGASVRFRGQEVWLELDKSLLSPAKDFVMGIEAWEREQYRGKTAFRLYRLRPVREELTRTPWPSLKPLTYGSWQT